MNIDCDYIISKVALRNPRRMQLINKCINSFYKIKYKILFYLIFYIIQLNIIIVNVSYFKNTLLIEC